MKENRRGDSHTGSRTSHIATPTAPSALGEDPTHTGAGGVEEARGGGGGFGDSGDRGRQ